MQKLAISVNGQTICHNQKVPYELVHNQSQYAPKIICPKLDPNKLYTLIMVDRDAPSRYNPINSFYLHWMIINTNDVIAEYIQPSPPKNSGEHRYYVILYEQSNKINYDLISRARFNLELFIKNNNLIPLYGMMFTTEND
jgi:phosphatidylethanolamine-binding protein (PEBP) family uncharacterized protein